MSQPQPFVGQAHGIPVSPSNRLSAEFYSPINGNAPVPVPRAHIPVAMKSPVTPGPTSPPNSKNTSHVPCKFFRLGQCQAGNSCPFLHADNITPCKYYQKGNCKFGLRCANEHITADGHRVNKPAHLQMNYNMARGQIPPINPLFPAQAQPSFPHTQIPMGHPDDFFSNQMNSNIPTIDTTNSSLPNSAYGSPQNDSMLAKSPIARGLSVLDAPLPASFESQGISIYARNGPIAASVPTRFGLEGSSPPVAHNPIESSLLRGLNHSAFADESINNKLAMSSSPPAVPDDNLDRRKMHSDRRARSNMLSSSVGAKSGISEEWDQNFVFEEDLLPDSLNDLLTPQERLRRLSRTANDDESNNLNNHRAALSGLGTPGEATSPKIGSPLGASPSRYGSLFAKQREQAFVDGGSNSNVNSFGHVGSPLRSSLLGPSSPGIRPTNGRPLSGEFTSSTPPRTMGIISQQLQRVRLSTRGSDSNIETNGNLSNRPQASSGNIPIPPGRLQDRSISTASSIGKRSEKIDEEPALFRMEEFDTGKLRTSTNGAIGEQRANGRI